IEPPALDRWHPGRPAVDLRKQADRFQNPFALIADFSPFAILVGYIDAETLCRIVAIRTKRRSQIQFRLVLLLLSCHRAPSFYPFGPKTQAKAGVLLSLAGNGPIPP